MYPKM